MTYLGGSTFEDQNTSTVGGGGTAGSNVNVKRWDGNTNPGNFVVDTTDPPRGCTTWLKIPGGVAAGTNLSRTLSAGVQTVTGGIWVKFGSGTPSGAQRFFGVTSAAATGVRLSTNGKVSVLCNGAGAVDLLTITAGAHYWVTFKANSSANPWTITASIYDEAGNQLAEQTTTAAIAAADLALGFVGINGASGGVDMFLSCPFYTNTTADYPLPRIGGTLLKPAACGTHSFTAGDFQDEASSALGTSETTSYTKLQEVPANTTAFVKQVAINASGYLEYTFGSFSSTTLGDPIFVNEVASMHPVAASTANTAAFRLNDGGTITAEAVLDTSVATDTLEFRMHGYAVRPNGSTAWTLPAVNALRARFGYSTDATPPPALDNIYLEVFAPLVDKETGIVTLTPSDTESYGTVDAGEADISLTVSAPVEGKELLDASTVLSTLTPAGAEAITYNVPFTLTPFSDEPGWDAGLVTLTLSANATDSAAYVDVPSWIFLGIHNYVPLTISPQDVVESNLSLTTIGKGKITLAPATAQLYQGVDAGTILVVLTPTAPVEGKPFLDTLFTAVLESNRWTATLNAKRYSAVQSSHWIAIPGNRWVAIFRGRGDQ